MKVNSDIIGHEVKCTTCYGVYTGVVKNYDGDSFQLDECKVDGAFRGEVNIYKGDLIGDIIIIKVPKKKGKPQVVQEENSINESTSCDDPAVDEVQKAFDESGTFLAADEYYRCKYPLNQPLPEKVELDIATLEGDELVDEIYNHITNVPLWSHPVPLVVLVSTGPQLNDSVEVLSKISLISINMFGEQLDRFHDPSYVVIAGLKDNDDNVLIDGKRCVIYTYKYNLHTLQTLKPILMSNHSVKLVPQIDFISDVLFNRVFKDEIWDVYKHRLVDLMRFSYEIRLVDYLYKASDVSVYPKPPHPILIDFDTLVKMNIHSLDDLHFPLLVNPKFCKHEYRLLAIDPPAIATYNFLSRTVVTQFIMYCQFISLRDERLHAFTQRGIEFYYKRDDVRVRGIIERRNPRSFPFDYNPRVILNYIGRARAVPQWSNSPLVITKVDLSNLDSSVEALSKEKIIAINILGPQIDRFADPKSMFLAIAKLEGITAEQTCRVFIFPCSDSYLLRKVRPVILSEHSHKIVHHVDPIADVLFTKFYRGDIWNASSHHIIDLCRLDHEIHEIRQLRTSNSMEKIPGRRLTPLIEDYLKEMNCGPQYFPFTMIDGLDESYLLELPFDVTATQNYVAKRVQSLFYLHHRMQVARDVSLVEMIRAGINRITLEKNVNQVKKKTCKGNAHETLKDPISRIDQIEQGLKSLEKLALSVKSQDQSSLNGSFEF